MAKTQPNSVAPSKPTSEKLKELLDLLNIKVVYYVDDENNLSDFDVQIIVGELQKIYGLERQDQLAAIQLENWDRSLPQEEVIDALRNLWSGIDFEIKKDLYRQVLNISNGENLQLDFKRAALVEQQIPKELIKVLSPTEWDTEKHKISSTIKTGERALILFDEELKFAGGRFTSEKGQDLIVEVKKMDVSDKVICTLLTHKISSAKEELKFRDEVISERASQDLGVNDFFPLAKQRLDDAEVFADGIKKTLVNNYFETVKKHTVEIIENAYTEAIKKIKGFDTYDFDATILKSSVKDGVWEPETIIRIADIVFENEVKKRMSETDYALKVNPQLKASQKFTGIDFTVPENMQPYSDKLFLRHQEIYDPGSSINPLRKPLENGDIFTIGDSQYILVAQACDMAVRKKDGKIGLRTAKTATLLKIKVITTDELKKKEKEPGHYFRDKYPLSYFKAGSTDIGIVDFTDYLIVDIDYLDLCVFNKEGECKINLNRLDSKEYLSHIWENRYDLLIEKIKSYNAKIIGVRKYLRPGFLARNVRRLAPLAIRNKPFMSRGNINPALIEKEFYPKFVLASSNPIDSLVKIEADSTFTFSTKRVAKYKDYGATYLLERYTRHLSRIAEPHDFALSKN